MAETTNPVEEQIKTLFGDPETGPEETGNLPEKGQVVAETSVTEEQIDKETAAAEEAEKQTPEARAKYAEEQAQKRLDESHAAKGETVETKPAEVPQEDRIAVARLRQIERLRQQRAKDREEFTKLRQDYEELKKTILGGGGEEDDALVQEQLNANPALKRISDRIESLDKIVTEKAAAEEESTRVVKEAEEVHRYAAESAAAFREHTPDFNDAYYWQREQIAKERGIDKWPAAQREQQLNLWEHQFSAEMAQSGFDPAEVIYEIAKAGGWKPGLKASDAATVPPNGNGGARPTIAAGAVRRLRDSTPSLSQSGTGGQATGDRITREEFYRRYSKEQRIALFQGPHGEDIFEDLDTTGEVSVSMLPR